jgi:hypothetical protein
MVDVVGKQAATNRDGNGRIIEIDGWANARWLARRLEVRPSTLEEFLLQHRRYLQTYKIKVQGFGVLYAVNAVTYLHSIPRTRDRWEIWKLAKPACPPVPKLR